LIAGRSGHIPVFLRIAKETGARAGEIYNLSWTDIDSENRTLHITPEKGNRPRLFTVTPTLVLMLQKLPKDDQRIFSHYSNLNYLRRRFDRHRHRLAHRLANPRLLQITFHTLRHWKATTEYHRTKDILHIMQVLGHKNIRNTLRYTQLMDNTQDDDYVCKVARTLAEVKELIETGFEYICDQHELKFFRKRK